MNLCFLVEGVTERKLYPKWLEHLLPSFTRVHSPDEADENNYYLISGGDFPSLLDNHLTNSVQDIADSGNYDYLVVVLDALQKLAEASGAEALAEVIQAHPELLTNQTDFKKCRNISF